MRSAHVLSADRLPTNSNRDKGAKRYVIRLFVSQLAILSRVDAVMTGILALSAVMTSVLTFVAVWASDTDLGSALSRASRGSGLVFWEKAVLCCVNTIVASVLALATVMPGIFSLGAIVPSVLALAAVMSSILTFTTIMTGFIGPGRRSGGRWRCHGRWAFLR